jgi:glucose dehydrogenase
MYTKGIYTPSGLEGTMVTFPSTLGGGNWGGVAFDPDLRLAVTNVMNLGQVARMELRTNPRTSGCHGLKTVVAARRTRREWQSVVESMAAVGAPGTAADISRTVQYWRRASAA